MAHNRAAAQCRAVHSSAMPYHTMPCHTVSDPKVHFGCGGLGPPTSSLRLCAQRTAMVAQDCEDDPRGRQQGAAVALGGLSLVCAHL
jgi:hypothetical protein